MKGIQSSTSEGECNATASRYYEGFARGDPGNVRLGKIFAQLWVGVVASTSGEDAHFANQWLRVLFGHAFEGRPCSGRNGTASIRIECVARGAILYGARTGGVGVDGGADADCRHACAG